MNTNDDEVLVRNLRPRDLEAVILLDSKITGRRRAEYFKLKLAQALSDTGIQVSLAAEFDGTLAGFLLARVYYGEFGVTGQTAVLDTVGVAPNLRGKGIGRALLRQLRHNLEGLGISRLQTEVSWDDQALLRFFHQSGFRPAPRISLDLDLQAARVRDEERDISAAGASKYQTRTQ
jgi:ribosomal protein S18 acetylase RimI-like enzyme